MSHHHSAPPNSAATVGGGPTTDPQQQQQQHEAPATAEIRVSDPMPSLPPVPEIVRKKFAAPRLQVLAQMPKTHHTVWLAGFSPLLSPNVRTTRCPRGIMFALGNLGPEELARAVPILLLDKPLCIHFAKFGSCTRPGCAAVCTHRDELQMKTFIGVRYQQLQNLSKADIKKMVQATLLEDGIDVTPQIPKRFVYYKDAEKDANFHDDDVIGEGGYTETGQRRMRTEDEGDDLLENDKGDGNVMFENEAARSAYMEQRAQEHEARRRRLIAAARLNASNLPALTALPPDVDEWWKEKKIINAFNAKQGLPPITSTTLLEMEKQNERDPSELFPPIPNISYADSSNANQLHRLQQQQQQQHQQQPQSGAAVSGNQFKSVLIKEAEEKIRREEEEKKLQSALQNQKSEEELMMEMFNQPLSNNNNNNISSNSNNTNNNNMTMFGGVGGPAAAAAAAVGMYGQNMQNNNRMNPMMPGGYSQQMNNNNNTNNLNNNNNMMMSMFGGGAPGSGSTTSGGAPSMMNNKQAFRHQTFFCEFCQRSGHSNERCRKNPANASNFDAEGKYIGPNTTSSSSGQPQQQSSSSSMTTNTNDGNNNSMFSSMMGGSPNNNTESQQQQQYSGGDLGGGNFGLL